MDNNKSRLKIVGITAVCTAASMVLMLCAGILTPLAFVFTVCTSVFSAYLYIRCGGAAACISALLTALLMLILSGGALQVLIIAAMGFVPGLASGYSQKRCNDYYTSLGITCTAFAVMTAALLFYGASYVDGGINAVFNATADAMKESMNAIAKTEGIPFPEGYGQLIDTAVSYMKMLLPSMVIIFSMIAGYIHITAVHFFAVKVSGICPNYIPFDMHKAPRHISYVYFIAAVLLMFLNSDGKYYVIMNNVVSIFDAILAFCGLSFIENKFKGKVKIGVLRALIYGAVLIVAKSFAVEILSLAGMLDSFADFRKIGRIGE